MTQQVEHIRGSFVTGRCLAIGDAGAFQARLGGGSCYDQASKPGRWFVEAELREDQPYGRIVTRLTIHHEEHSGDIVGLTTDPDKISPLKLVEGELFIGDWDHYEDNPLPSGASNRGDPVQLLDHGCIVSISRELSDLEVFAVLHGRSASALCIQVVPDERDEAHDDGFLEMEGEEEQEPVPPEVLTALRSSTFVREASDVLFLRFVEDDLPWVELPADSKQFPKKPGIYGLGIRNAISYDEAPSRIIYFGSGSNISGRIWSHSHESHNAIIRAIRKALDGQLYAFTVPLPKVKVEWLRTIEAEAIRAFARVTGVAPIANREIPYSDFEVHDLVEIVPTSNLASSAISIDEFAKMLDMEATRGKIHLSGSAVLQISIVPRFTESGDVEVDVGFSDLPAYQLRNKKK